MKMVVRAFALVLLLATAGVWAGLGGTLGWTRTQIPVEKIDPVTDIKYVEWKAGFVPGVEFLVLGAGGAIVIFAATLFVRLTPKN
jgi:hypothetical protein